MLYVVPGHGQTGTAPRRKQIPLGVEVTCIQVSNYGGNQGDRHHALEQAFLEPLRTVPVRMRKFRVRSLKAVEKRYRRVQEPSTSRTRRRPSAKVARDVSSPNAASKEDRHRLEGAAVSLSHPGEASLEMNAGGDQMKSKMIQQAGSRTPQKPQQENMNKAQERKDHETAVLIEISDERARK